MKRQGATPEGGVVATDLRPLFDAAGPFVTLLLDTEPGVENAGPRLEQRWNVVRRKLAANGASEAALSRLDEVVEGAHLRGDALFAVADAERLWIDDAWPDPPARELARWAPLPTVTPLLARRQLEVPHIVALVDRAGGELATVTPGNVRDETIEGESGPAIRRSAPGGWSQMRYQHRAEVTWAHTARQIARALVDEFDRARAQLVIMAGDVRAVQLVVDDLPPRVREQLHLIAGGRAAGTDEDARHHAITRLVRTATAEATVGLLHKLREESGQDDRAVVGPEATVEAINRAQVDVLLVHDDPDDRRTAWFGPSPLPIGLEADVASMAGGDVQQARLADVLVRGAVPGNAEVRVIPSVKSVPGGIAAILRWS